MSYLLAKILICLLLAGLLGVVIGWLLRGGCSKRVRDCEDEWKMKMGSLESEWNSKLQRATSSSKKTTNETAKIQADTLKRHASHVETATPSYSYEAQLKESLQQSQEGTQKVEEKIKSESALTTLTGSAAAVTTAAIASVSTTNSFSLGDVQEVLAQRGINLNSDLIELYNEHGIDFKEGTNLESSYDISAIEGIGPKYAQKLKEMGIDSTETMVKTFQNNYDKVDQVAKALKIQPEALSSWVSMADLIQLPGMDAQAAELIQTVGIASCNELGITNPSSLHKEMVSFNKKSPIVSQVPDATSVSLWSKIARAIS